MKIKKNSIPSIPVMLALALILLAVGYYVQYQPLLTSSVKDSIIEERFQSTPISDSSCTGLTPVSNQCLPNMTQQSSLSTDCIQDKSCAIPPDNFNLYPQDLQPTVKKENQEVECPEKNRLPICSSASPCGQNYQSPYLVPPPTTPDMPDQSQSSELQPSCQQEPFSMYPFSKSI